MKQKRMKKLGSFLLAGAMVLTMFPTFHTEVHAAENNLPTEKQFATAEELKQFNTNNNDGTTNPAKVYFGNNSQKWWIAGSQGEKELTLFAASPLATNQLFEPNGIQSKTYSEDWECTYIGENPGDVYPNHYGASPLRTTLKGLESSYFTSKEQDLMNNTTVYTNDIKNNSVYSTTNKLYLAYGVGRDLHVTVGKNASDSLNNGLRIDIDYWGGSAFWLRSPHDAVEDSNNQKDLTFATLANTGYHMVSAPIVNDPYALVPAFELNLSSVIFASAAPAASSDGQLSENDAFTLRYKADNLGTALVSYNKSKVTLTDVPENTYLVVQNSSGAWAKKITNEKEVSAGTMGVDSFANCKVWLETTETANRMTYATLATEKQGYDVNVVASEGLNISSNNGVQEVAPNTAITDITVEVTGGYYLPEDYISNLQGQLNNGLTATKTDNGFKISGTPTSDVTVTLPAATKTVTGSGTIPVISKPAQPNDNNSDKDNANSDTNKESPKTGDQTNAGFFTALLSMSALGIAVLTVLKKKKTLEHK